MKTAIMLAILMAGTAVTALIQQTPSPPKMTSHAPDEFSEHTRELGGGKVYTYKFLEPKDSVDEFDSGDVVPHRYQEIQRCEQAPGKQRPQNKSFQPCMVIGYVEIHLHRVKVDDADLEDVSVGSTVRINPKRK